MSICAEGVGRIVNRRRSDVNHPEKRIPKSVYELVFTAITA